MSILRPWTSQVYWITAVSIGNIRASEALIGTLVYLFGGQVGELATSPGSSRSTISLPEFKVVKYGDLAQVPDDLKNIMESYKNGPANLSETRVLSSRSYYNSEILIDWLPRLTEPRDSLWSFNDDSSPNKIAMYNHFSQKASQLLNIDTSIWRLYIYRDKKIIIVQNDISTTPKNGISTPASYIFSITSTSEEDMDNIVKFLTSYAINRNEWNKVKQLKQADKSHILLKF